MNETHLIIKKTRIVALKNHPHRKKKTANAHQRTDVKLIPKDFFFFLTKKKKKPLKKLMHKDYN